MSTTRWLQLSFIILCLIAGLLHHYQWISWDVSWLMEVTNRMLHGGQYGLNYIETNPPLILYLYALPVWFSQHFALHDYTVVKITGYVFSLISLLLSYALSKQVFNDNKHIKPWLFTLLLLFIFIILPGNQFMQRENLLIILSTPYLILVSLRLDNQPCSPLLSACIGFLAAIAFCIKPYFLLIPVVLEFIVYWRNKQQCSARRYETYGLLITVMLYAISIYVFFPSYFTLLTQLILPYYHHYAVAPIMTLLLNRYTLFVFITVLVYFMLKRHHRYQQLALVYTIFTIISCGIFILTGQDWFYHLLPMFSAALILLMLNLDALFHFQWDGKIKSSWQYNSSMVLIIFAMLIAATQIILFNAANIASKHNPNNTINKLIHYFKSNDIKSVYSFSLHLQSITAADYSGVKFVGRFPNHWLIAYIANHQDDTSQTNQAAHDYRNIVLADLKQYPGVVVVNNPNREPYIKPIHFNYIQFLSKDPRFKPVWSRYKLATTLNNLLIYRFQKK